MKIRRFNLAHITVSSASFVWESPDLGDFFGTLKYWHFNMAAASRRATVHTKEQVYEWP